MKKIFGIGTGVLLLTAGLLVLTAGGRQESAQRDFAGTYVGYSWQHESRGTMRADSSQVIETILTLDSEANITDFSMRFWVLRDGYWTTRNAGNALVLVDYSVDPSSATGRIDAYEDGTSMFTIGTQDMMSFYAVGVDSDGTTAVAIVCPVTRYQMEMKFSADYDFDRSMGEITIGSGELVPTWLTSGSSIVRPASWSELDDRNLFSISVWSHVINDVGVLAGVDENSSVREFLSALGVEWSGGSPQEKAVSYGYFGMGGWNGNHNAIAEYMIGRNAREVTSLIDWSDSRFAPAINDDNFFGVDTPTGATRTVQNSFDGVSGATVRMSREATSYQRALVAAGILTEDQVIKGRF